MTAARLAKTVAEPTAKNSFIFTILGTKWGILWLWLLIINVVAFLAYGGDKLLAKLKEHQPKVPRLPEKNLLLLALVGGGVGIPPLYGLARRLTAEHRQVTAVLGYNRASDIFLAEELHALGVTVRLLTADGSAGTCGLVTDGMEGVNYTHLYTCGPEAMLHAVWQRCRTDGQFSFEERMGCGFGACMGCTCRTKYGHKRICKDGPVLRREEIVW